MRRNCCHAFLAFLLKFFNFLHAFVGVSIVIYSLWMINQWNHHIPMHPASATSPSSSSLSIYSNSQPTRVSAQITPLDLAVDTVSSFDDGLHLDFNSFKLPAPWFIYSFMGVGILVCCITFLGCIAVEIANGCCLCFYTILITALILLEAALVAFIAVDHRWEEDLPIDPSGELESLRSFIEDNLDMCKWVGITVLIVQAISLLLALIMRAMVSSQRTDSDSEDEYDVRGRNWGPQVKPQVCQPSGSTKGDNRGTASDLWSSLLRNKHGLNSSDKDSLPIQNSLLSKNPRQ